jgi:hypothetical protein
LDGSSSLSSNGSEIPDSQADLPFSSRRTHALTRILHHGQRNLLCIARGETRNDSAPRRRETYSTLAGIFATDIKG